MRALKSVIDGSGAYKSECQVRVHGLGGSAAILAVAPCPALNGIPICLEAMMHGKNIE